VSRRDLNLNGHDRAAVHEDIRSDKVTRPLGRQVKMSQVIEVVSFGAACPAGVASDRAF
jgi:hypothetical protein